MATQPRSEISPNVVKMSNPFGLGIVLSLDCSRGLGALLSPLCLPSVRVLAGLENLVVISESLIRVLQQRPLHTRSQFSL